MQHHCTVPIYMMRMLASFLFVQVLSEEKRMSLFSGWDTKGAVVDYEGRLLEKEHGGLVLFVSVWLLVNPLA